METTLKIIALVIIIGVIPAIKFIKGLPNANCTKTTYNFEVEHDITTYQDYCSNKNKDTLLNVCNYTIEGASLRTGQYILRYRQHINGKCVEKTLYLGHKAYTPKLID